MGRILALVLAVTLTLLPGSDASAQRAGTQKTKPAPAAQQLPPLDVEGAYYRQLHLLDQMMAGITPSAEKEPSVYFVGFASFATQDVFIREIDAARAIVEQRFATQGRSMLLINHRETVDEVPLANLTNLSIVLKRLGQIMNNDKDVLFLFMTSHGVRNRFIVHFPDFSMNQIAPEDLAAVLAQSGIKNRVIVLSSCYSGSFVPALKSPEALVMTAARADRTSFGCSHQRAWTYFGDALFNRALRETASLPAAFERARGLVGQWEAANKLTPSEPQIEIGEAMRPVIEDLARRFARTDQASN